MHVEGEGCTNKINRDEQGEEGGPKFEVSSEHTFGMTLKLFCYN